jgi:glyoxylase-like metal-dependent hydrolase (beta-lactamase superfamily II)
MIKVISLLLLFFVPFTTFSAENVTEIKLGSYSFFSLVTTTRNIGETNFVNQDLLSKYTSVAGWNGSSITFFMLDNGKDKILFDTGLGGDSVSLLNSIGVKPNEISAVYLTHMHGDHIGGMLDSGGKAVFNKATVYISKEEAEYWKSGTGGNFALAQSVMDSYGKNVVLFEQNKKITPNIISIPAFGHTPGHTAYKIADGKDSILVWGDVIHATVQFAAPNVYLRYDVDAKTALETRQRLLQAAAKEKQLIAGMHLVAPAIGTVTKEASGYKFNLYK